MRQRDSHDAAIRSALQELRSADTRHVPSFENVLARQLHTEYHAPWASLAVAASIVLIAALVYRVVVQPSTRLTVSNEVIALSQWRAPTQMLLETSRTSLLTQAPQLGASLIDIGIRGDLR